MRRGTNESVPKRYAADTCGVEYVRRLHDEGWYELRIAFRLSG
jgi:hypothetical protein